MEVDYTRIYNVLLNNLPWAKKPSLATIRSLTYYLPDAVVMGFGYIEYYKLWYLTVYSPTFPINPYTTLSNLSWSHATGAKSYTMTQGTEPVKI